MASRFCLSSLSPSLCLSLLLPALLLLRLPVMVKGDCWLIEGDKGYVWLAICSQNQPPYETIPQHINSTVHDLRLNENKLKAVLFISMYRFTNLTDLNLTKNEISYIEDGAFAGQANLQVLQLGYNKLTNLTEGMLRGLGRMQCLFLQHNLIEVIATNAFWECPNLSSLDLSSNKLARLDPSTFTVLSRLMVCELAGNPFHCGCELYSFLTWLEEFNNVTHTYDRLQCETPSEMTGYPLLSPVSGHGRNARYILLSVCRDGVIISGMTSQMPDPDGSGMVLDNLDQGMYHQPTISSTADPNYNHQISMNLQTVSLYTASLMVQIPRPYSKMYILSQYNHTYVADIMPLKNKKEIITLDKLKPHTNYTFCVASASKSQRYNHTCLSFTTRDVGPKDHRTNPSTTTHYIMTILGCLFGMVIVLGLVYYCLRRRRIQEEKEKAISVKKTILEMRYGPEAAAAVANDPGAMQRLQEQAHHQHHHSGAGGKLPQSASSSTGMLHGSANTSSSRLSTLPQVEKMATAFSEAMGGKGNYMDVRMAGVAGEGREGVVAAGGAVVGGEVVVDMRGGAENGTEAGEDSDDDGRGSASEISTIAKEVDKVNQIINNCIDALKLDASANVVTTADNANSVSTAQPPCIASLPRNLLPLSPGHPGDQIMASSPKVHTKSHPQPHPQPHPQAHPQSHPQPHPQLHQQPHPPSMAPVPLVVPLSERPGISGGGFLSPPYRDPPPANAVRPLQRQLSADTAVVKNRCGAPAAGSVKNTRVYSVDIPEQRSDPPKYPAEKGSPAGCGGGGGSGGGSGVGGCNGNGMGNMNGGGVSLNGGGMGCNNGSGGGGGMVGPAQQQHHLEVQPDYHSSEHRHSFPALYYEGGNESPSPAQKASFLKPLGRTKRDATAAYSQLSPSRHHNYNSGYSSSPEYSSESTLRIWERFRPYKKSPREEASYIAAGHALRKKVQFAKDEDLHDILDYWKGVSAQQKL
ncbi:extracellular leucine-rich repeat and fibronectin type III domain containing 2a [Amphiprion ocellaris]|uniref:LRRCT domain-containing protein n=1 Tax=Amphiprion ocellaris TaxID=80972 RepID=A0AAQ6ANV2_AMPOC|nr:extracellular leucine-rich repeat and fibronectin type III domain containing 2a [Amphiprion ocellaris]XP_054866252.1 extracellular leucine-rich repeat and fibronectin type III domain containing 2a [Amphiprion ocellaris]XP_054866253.1 extracellular leucine-rich repeat and fibronectin type III domain containing 2a [Amphiprion ocellaris]